MNGLRIVHILSSFGMGGQERVAVDLAKAQLSAGHEVIAVSLAGEQEEPIGIAFRQAGAQTETIAKRSGFDPTLSVRVAARLASLRIDVVHTHNPQAMIYGTPVARLLRAAAVHSKHGINPDMARRKWLRRTVSKWVDAYVAVTPALSEIALQNRECDPAKLHVIPNGIDTRLYTPNPAARQRVRRELRIPENAWVVGTVGRLAREKDQGLLIQAMANLFSEHNRLLIVGAGSERDALMTQAKVNGNEQFVHFLGERRDIPDVLTAFDVFALPSRMEGLPLVLLEAMATGIPVLATAVGGIPDLVKHEETGFLIPPGDTLALNTSLSWLVSKPHAAFEVAEKGRQVVLERYSSSRMASDYERLYRSVVTRPRASPGGVALGAHG
ncbi:MAG TPA: glycosyltransferase [Polyangiaceae bacterium]|nr:glycosyltransferase [Polyangiaceae bacterium]